MVPVEFAAFSVWQFPQPEPNPYDLEWEDLKGVLY